MSPEENTKMTPEEKKTFDSLMKVMNESKREQNLYVHSVHLTQCLEHWDIFSQHLS